MISAGQGQTTDVEGNGQTRVCRFFPATYAIRPAEFLPAVAFVNRPTIKIPTDVSP